MNKMRNFNHYVNSLFCFKTFGIDSELNLNRKIYLGFNTYIFTTEIIIYSFSDYIQDKKCE